MRYDQPHFLEIRRHSSADPRKKYNELYKDYSLAQITSYYCWLVSYLPRAGTLLDMSCGRGDLIREAQKRGIEVVGIDISEEVAKQAKIGSELRIAVAAGETLPFPSESFDFVTNIGSLEHYSVPAEGVSEISRVLKPAGKALILVPNTFSLTTNIWNALRFGYTTVDLQPIQRYGARADWSLLLESNGLEIRHTYKFERPWPRVVSDWGYYLKHFKDALRLLAGPFIPLNLSFCFLFECAKRRSRSENSIPSFTTRK